MNTMSNKPIKSLLVEEDIVVVSVQSEKYSEKVMSILECLLKEEGNVGYISVNKPFETLIKNFSEHGLDYRRFHIIDCISATVKKLEKKKRFNGVSYFTNSPKNLTEISLTVGEILDDIKILFVDAISTLMVYEKETAVIRFAHDIINKLRLNNKKGIFIVLQDDDDQGLLDDLKMFADSAICL